MPNYSYKILPNTSTKIKFQNSCHLHMLQWVNTSVHLLLCIQSSRGSCRSEWTTFSSTSSPGRLQRETHNIWFETEEVTVFVHVKANLQETSAPRATSGSDHHLSVLLGSIRGWILPPPTAPSPQRAMPEGSAGKRKGGGGGGWACENSVTQCYLPGAIPDM